MNIELQPYKHYKDSGQDWVGKVPSHWDVSPVFGVFNENHERNVGLKENVVLSLSYGRIIIKPSEKLRGLVPESFETYQIVNPGDIIIRTTDLQNDRTSLRVGMVRNRGIITSAYLALKVKKQVIPEFGYHLLNVWDSSKAIYGYGSGLRQNLGFFHFKRMLVAIPPEEEQLIICRFLNYMNGKIEQVIKTKKQELALISEMLQSVTLNAMQQSGVAHLRLSTVTEPMLRPIDRKSSEIYTPVGLYNRGRGIFHKLPRKGDDLGDSDFFRLEAGDLIISGQFAWEGAVALVRDKDEGCIASHRYPILRGRNEHLSSAVLLAILRTQYGTMLLNHHSRGAAGRNRPLNDKMLLKEKLPIPALKMQPRIVELLDQEYAVAQSLSKLTKYLNEYRASLAIEVVTGKIDVREAAKNLETILEDADKDNPLSDEIELEEQEEAA